MSEKDPSSQKKVRGFLKDSLGSGLFSLLLIGFPALFVYLAYSDFTLTGPMGYLFAFEIQTLGWADEGANLFAAAMLSLLLAGLLGMGLTALFDLNPRRSPAAETSAGPAPKRSSRGLLFVLILLGGGVAVFLHERNQKLYSLDLGDRTATLPHDAGFVELRAIPAHRYLAAILIGSTKGPSRYTVYEPLVGPGWTPGLPIRFFLHYDGPYTRTSRRLSRRSDLRVGETGFEGAGALPSAILADEMTHIGGQVMHPLPVVIRQDYEARGLTLAPDCVVLDWVRLSNHKVSVWDRFGFFTYLGIIIACLALILLVGFTYSGLARLFGSGHGKPDSTPKA
jgi:hypothetical protein